MTDQVDRANELAEVWLSASLHAATSIPIVPGVPGECERCGEDMPRLVGGLCAPCRDGRNKIGARR